jgi:hypothetical protein
MGRDVVVRARRRWLGDQEKRLNQLSVLKGRMMQSCMIKMPTKSRSVLQYHE